MIDRKTPPNYQTISDLPLIKPDEHKLSNQIPVFILDKQDFDFVKIDFLFDAGRKYQTQQVVASSTNSLMKEGTKNYTSEEISLKFDFWGIKIRFSNDSDFALISVTTLTKYLNDALIIVEEIIKNPVFPKNEFDLYVMHKKQELAIDYSKVKVMAKNHFLESIFGKNHPYGNYAQISDYDQLGRTKLVEFHKKHFKAEKCRIIVAGQIQDKVLQALNDHFGGKDWLSQQQNKKTQFNIEPGKERQVYAEKKDAVQNAVRIGRKMFNRLHPDYIGMEVLSTTLGGYFSSRLMKNLREEKGYTYGIGSTMVSLADEGYFAIISEFRSEATTAVMHEIYKEIKILQEKSIPDEELLLVKNYMIGELLRLFDGIISISEAIKMLLVYDLNYNYFQNVIQEIKTIRAGRLQELANQYLNKNELVEVIAGQK
jgi:predicted Zn-dependent peptidase